MPLVALAAIGVAGGIATSAIGAHAAGKAADSQVSAANYAANLQAKSAQQALDFQKQQFAYQQQIQAPWLQAGTGALSNLQYLMGIPNNPSPSGAQGGGFTGTPAAPGTTSGYGGGSGGAGGYSGGGYSGYPQSGLGAGGNTPVMHPMSSLSTQDAGAPQVGTASKEPGLLNQPGGAPGGIPGTPGAQGAPGSQVNPALGGFGSLMQPWTEKFQAPTDVTEKNDPGYQFRLNQGTDAIQRSAAARGGVLTGGTAKDLTNYAQDYASNEYGNVYNRAWNNYANNYNVFQNNQSNAFNRLAALSGFGQTSANNLGMFGQNAANMSGNILMQSAAQQGQDAQNAGAARASGYVGGANALNQGIGSATNSLSQYLLLQQLMNNGGGGGGTGGIPNFPTICWVAAELYGGWSDPRTKAVRSFLTTKFNQTTRGAEFVRAYEKHGPKIAEMVKESPELREFMKPIFDQFVEGVQ